MRKNGVLEKWSDGVLEEENLAVSDNHKLDFVGGRKAKPGRCRKPVMADFI